MKIIIILLIVALASLAFIPQKVKPVLYIIGDSTVRNGDGTGKGQQWGWGSFVADYFDTAKITVENDAIGGRSSRTFITEGRWEKILKTLKEGDFVIMQFGHNDGGALDDTARARGTISGIGNESKDIYNPIMKKQETVYTYGWYMRKYIDDTRAKGATAIVCSPIPRNDWANGKVKISGSSHALWASQVAASRQAYFIELDKLIAMKYEKLGEAKVNTLFPADRTHTNKEGAELNARIVVQEIKGLKKCKLKKYLK